MRILSPSRCSVMALGATVATLTALLPCRYTAQHSAPKSNHSYNDTNGFRRVAVAWEKSEVRRNVVCRVKITGFLDRGSRKVTEVAPTVVRHRSGVLVST